MKRVIFLGCQILDFKPKDGDYIKGSKVFFAFPPELRNWEGLEVHSTFLDFEKDRICYDICRKLIPLNTYDFDFPPTFSGKPHLIAVHEVKEDNTK